MSSNSSINVIDIEEKRMTEWRVYDGRILNVRVDRVKLPSGRIAAREVIEHKPAVGVLALTDHETVLLVRQYRYPIQAETLEICAGLIEEGEDPKDAASREMQEEMKVKPARLREIGGFYASPGFCTEYVTVFLAEGLTQSDLPQDEDENVSVREIAVKDIPDMMAAGAFRDSKTFAALAWLMANYNHK